MSASDGLTVNMEAKPVKSVKWFLNGPGAWLNRHLPAKALVVLWGPLLGWLPVMRWRLETDDDWETLTVQDAMSHLLEKRRRP